MVTVGQRIKELRLSRGLTQEQLAEILGTSKSRIGMYEIDKREPNFEMLETLADYFNVDMNYLLGKSDIGNRFAWLSAFDNIHPIETKRFPFLGEVACGEPIFANEDRESYIEAGTNIKADFCLKAKGNSMTGARIMDGDIVFVRKQDTVENGDIAVVIINDEATLKRFYYYPDKNTLILKPENSDYEDFIYINEDLNHVKILGKAVAFQSDVK